MHGYNLSLSISDLQFSSEDELEEVVGGLSEEEGDGGQVAHLDDDSQQAAEAMMQLGNISYCGVTSQEQQGMIVNSLGSIHFYTKYL